MPVPLQALALLIFPALMVWAALEDVTTFTISNRLNAVLVVAFCLAAPLSGAPIGLIGLNLAVGAAGLLIGMGLFALGWIGGGDAKLLAAASLWLGWPALTTFLLATTLAGGALAILLLGLRAQLVRNHTPALAGWMERLTTPGAPAPYGVAIACGALFAFPICSLAQAGHLVAPLVR
ncbi:MAG TPA: prepilin peptidase [Caulobacteraceae bacterium]|nr:prepilin peptidase [Caulobacteraceae bacterium]